MPPTLADQVTISSEVLFQQVASESVLLDLASETYFGLDEVGTRIWQLLQEHSRLRTVYETMLDEYDVEPAQLEQDLLKLIGELADAGLVIYGQRYAAAEASPS
ncbi:MAG: PqqD family protein [Chromatiaceae bacterium]|jgi:predicted component of type VI protein secretion system|nr:PqqD family protein [Chromatiaceae bacterium]